MNYPHRSNLYLLIVTVAVFVGCDIEEALTPNSEMRPTDLKNLSPETFELEQFVGKSRTFVALPNDTKILFLSVMQEAERIRNPTAITNFAKVRVADRKSKESLANFRFSLTSKKFENDGRQYMVNDSSEAYQRFVSEIE